MTTTAKALIGCNLFLGGANVGMGVGLAICGASSSTWVFVLLTGIVVTWLSAIRFWELAK